VVVVAILEAPELDFVTCVIVMGQAYNQLFEAHGVVTREWHVLCRLAARTDAPTQAGAMLRAYHRSPYLRVVEVAGKAPNSPGVAWNSGRFP